MEHNGDGMVLSINSDSVSGNSDASREIIGIQSAYAGDNDSVLNTGDCNTYEQTQSEIFAPEVHAADLNGKVSMMPITTVNLESKGADDVNLSNLKTEIPDRYNLNADIHEISTNNKILLEHQPSGDKIHGNVDGEETTSILLDAEGISDDKARVMPMEKPLQISKKKKVPDAIRVQKVLEELSTKSLMPDQVLGGRYKRQKICSEARTLLLQYAKEISSAILEESCILARHRKSKELNIADVKLIFGNIFLASSGCFHDCIWFTQKNCFRTLHNFVIFSYLPLVTGKKFDINVSGYQLRASRLSVSAAPVEDEEEVEAVITLGAACTASTESPVTLIDEPRKSITEEVEIVEEAEEEDKKENDSADRVMPADLSGEKQEPDDSISYVREEATQASQFSISFSAQNSQQESQPMDELGGSYLREEATQASQFSISFSAQNSQQESQPMDELGGGVEETFNRYDNSVSNSSYVTQDT